MDTLYRCMVAAHIKGDAILQAQSLPHVRRSSSQHAVEDVVVSLFSRLRTDPGLLQEVVRHIPTHHLMLRERGGGREGGRWVLIGHSKGQLPIQV